VGYLNTNQIKFVLKTLVFHRNLSQANGSCNMEVSLLI